MENETVKSSKGINDFTVSLSYINLAQGIEIIDFMKYCVKNDEQFASSSECLKHCGKNVNFSTSVLKYLPSGIHTVQSTVLPAITNSVCYSVYCLHKLLYHLQYLYSSFKII